MPRTQESLQKDLDLALKEIAVLNGEVEFWKESRDSWYKGYQDTIPAPKREYNFFSVLYRKLFDEKGKPL